MGETFSAAAGMAASLDAEARADGWDGVTHNLVSTYQHPDTYGVCSCGTRVDGADLDQVRHLHAGHAEHERTVAVYRPAARRGLAASRERLRETTDRKAGKA